MALQLASPAFMNGGTFPVDYTCNGRNVNPPLTISNVPKGAASLALIFDDPDAANEPAGRGSTFDHWIIYNLLAADQAIAEDSVPDGCAQGKNSLGGSNYIGPCPPTFRHEYVFRLLALDCRLNFTSQPVKAEIEAATDGHVIGEARLIAYYQQPAG
jgi:Raf kinase inhibitor-like YbhB/YbcL family protein